MYSVILGHLGTDAVAANSLVTVVRNIGSVFCFAIASAGTILLGNVMGKGDLEKSKVYASRMLKMTVIAGAIGGVIVFAITPLVMRFASLSDGAMHYLKYMLLINTYYIMGSAVNTALIAGVFRAGGDTKFWSHLRYDRYVGICSTAWILRSIRAETSCALGILPVMYRRIRQVAMGIPSLSPGEMGTEYYKRGFV